MMARHSFVALAVLTLLAGGPSVASAQGGHDMAGMHMGGEIVIPKGARYTKADVEFMQGMIAHHAQAIVMSRMAEANGANPQVSNSRRRSISRRCLRSRSCRSGFAGTTSSRRTPRPGTTCAWTACSPTTSSRQLDAAKGVEFDRAFLICMIKHHAGALKMVDDLFKSPRAGQEVDANRSSPTMSSRHRPPRSAS